MSMLAFGKSRQTFFARFSGRRALRPRKVVVGCRSPHIWQIRLLYIHPYLSAWLSVTTFGVEVDISVFNARTGILAVLLSI